MINQKSYPIITLERKATQSSYIFLGEINVEPIIFIILSGIYKFTWTKLEHYSSHSSSLISMVNLRPSPAVCLEENKEKTRKECLKSQTTKKKTTMKTKTTILALNCDEGVLFCSCNRDWTHYIEIVMYLL